jgi:N-formylglutamate amidohydrolase
MTAKSAPFETDPFEILRPARRLCPLVFNSPHSGSLYPADFLASSRLDPVSLRRSEDMFVDEIFAGVVNRGSPMLRARFPRAYLDVNREPFELDPRMFDGRLPDHCNTRSMRVAGGLGTIARIVGEGQEIYAGKLRVEDALQRIESLYRPYHHALRDLLEETRTEFGFVLLIDCHSMPSGPHLHAEGLKPDVVLGDRYGTSCSRVFVDAAEEALHAAGYRISRNKPYAGGFITEHYGRPPSGIHALQIEINRSLYMDERRQTRSAAFGRTARNMMHLADALGDAARSFSRMMRSAAE